ncbi:MAG: response regulator transcription factor [Rhodocyclales bacterium]|nr:response regulator transcription factor [Rhodocyclales bacterium]
MTIAHLIDDDDAIRDALAWLLRSRGVASRAWSSAEAFLADYCGEMRGCIVLDIRMHNMSGPELFERMVELGCSMPIIFLTGHGDVPLAVNAIKRGAFDFIEKPFNDNELADRVIDALRIDAERSSQAASAATIEGRLAQLTSREREVMDLVLAGKFNKVIADELDIAMRTVEVHRARVFEKMGVRSAVELAQLLVGRAKTD